MAIDLIRAVEELENVLDFQQVRELAEDAAAELEEALKILSEIDSDGDSKDIEDGISDAISYINSALNNIR